MFEYENISEQITPDQSKGLKIWTGILIRFVSVVALVILTSYQIPEKSFKKVKINYTTDQLNESILTSTFAAFDYSKSGISQELKNKLNEKVQQFFEKRNYQPIWTSEYEITNDFKALKNLLDSAVYYGFPNDYFDRENIKALINDFNESHSLSARTNLEIKATYASFKLMLYLNYGIIEKDTSTQFESFVDTLPHLLENAFQQKNLRTVILDLQPEMVQFKQIVNTLPNFIDLHYSIKYTTPKFIDDRLLAKGLYYAGVAETAEIDSNETNARSIIKMQEKYNLPKDSSLNAPTHQFLLSLLQYRYYQTCLNLNRLRTLRNMDESFLFVNIPEFRLHVVESKQLKETFNVIVGKQETPTPVFSSNIEKVVTNPYWTVPKSIALNEMLPKIRKDSTYLARNGYFLINWKEEPVDMAVIDWNSDDPFGTRYFIRQKNSNSNALGLVKFVFPNEHDVYLHDTPSRGLFGQKNRTFSHGCIRLENPDKLAQYLTDKYLNNNNLNIKKLISTQQHNEIGLSEKVKIHIQYITCSANENSEIEFFSDIYKLDEQQIKAIFQDQML